MSLAFIWSILQSRFYPVWSWRTTRVAEEELPNPVQRRTTLKLTGKTNVKMQLSGKLFWIPANFHNTTEKLYLWKHFLQLEEDFVAAQIKPLTGDFCNSRENNGNFYFPAWLFKGNKAYLRNFIRSKSNPLVEAVKITDVIRMWSKSIIPVDGKALSLLEN